MKRFVAFVANEPELAGWLESRGLSISEVDLVRDVGDLELVDLLDRPWIIQPGFTERADLEEWTSALVNRVHVNGMDVPS